VPNTGAAYVFGRHEGGNDHWGQATILRAHDAQASDWFAASVAISGDTVVVGAQKESGGTGDPLLLSGAAYLFVLTGGARRASDAQAYDHFGWSVAISGDTLVVGVPDEDYGVDHWGTNAGAAYVFSRNTVGLNEWGEAAILRASVVQADDAFGHAVAISGDTVVVGAPRQDRGSPDPLLGYGAAYVFNYYEGGPGNWGQQAELFASDEQPGDLFGWSVGIAGDTVVVGAHGEDGGAGDPLSYAGAAYVFQRDWGEPISWYQATTLRASDAQAGDMFGWSVAIAGDSLVVSAVGEDGGPGDPLNGSGAAYLFGRYHGGADNWGQVTALRASDAQALDYYGTSVAFSGDTVVVGNANEDGGAGDPHPYSGAAYVYDRDVGGADNWGEATILRASDAGAYDYFGVSVAIDGDTVVVGASYEDGGAGDPLTDSGAVYLFGRDEGGAGNWGQAAMLRAPDGQSGDHFGASVAISGGFVVAGAPNEGGGEFTPLPHSGTVYLLATAPQASPGYVLYLPLVLRES
jgi:hypothetical protein